MSNELLEWLDANKIEYNVLEEDIIEIVGMGKMYFEDTNMVSYIFRTDLENNVKLNAT